MQHLASKETYQNIGRLSLRFVTHSLSLAGFRNSSQND